MLYSAFVKHTRYIPKFHQWGEEKHQFHSWEQEEVAYTPTMYFSMERNAQDFCQHYAPTKEPLVWEKGSEDSLSATQGAFEFHIFKLGELDERDYPSMGGFHERHSPGD